MDDTTKCKGTFIKIVYLDYNCIDYRGTYMNNLPRFNNCL